MSPDFSGPKTDELRLNFLEVLGLQVDHGFSCTTFQIKVLSPGAIMPLRAQIDMVIDIYVAADAVITTTNPRKEGG